MPDRVSDRIAPPSYEICISCGAPFTLADAGSLGCWFHPAHLDANTLHRPCCNGAEPDGACLAHTQSSRRRPLGCHRIDHFSDSDSRYKATHHRPYGIAALDQVHQCMLGVSEPDERMVFHISSPEELDRYGTKFTVRVPSTWSREDDGTDNANVADGRLRIDLRAEHDQLREALIERERDDMLDDATGADAYAAEWDRTRNGHRSTTVPDFIPFALFLRVDPERDDKRAAFVNTPCRY